MSCVTTDELITESVQEHTMISIYSLSSLLDKKLQFRKEVGSYPNAHKNIKNGQPGNHDLTQVRLSAATFSKGRWPKSYKNRETREGRKSITLIKGQSPNF